ncbi:undecaprenyldiphospho-muramoylpentapeptide beta-N-acetylglucosaminyltransferase [Candidatus Falkowbacteria bacterium]|nr:undecaprenyldiphospho-muramoylpentapeptide beta-N-acetylglucosaminyltransferase [Candidatus Falkowbacteria bacterium]
MKIILTGGGTMGSVTPLLAVAEELKKRVPDAEFFWFGTKNGPEKKIIESRNIKFAAVPAGKLRRYFSGWNFLMPFLLLAGFFKSLWLIFKFKPQMILSAGGFVAVPVVWAGWFLRVPSLIHQQDIRPGLANKLTARFAKIITVTFSDSLKYFSRAVVTGNPVRQEIFSGSKERIAEIFNLEKDLPILFILGGGTGALELNKIVVASALELVKFCQVIHMTGGRIDESLRMKIENIKRETARYHTVDFLTKDLPDVFAAADLVISRAGMATLTELAMLGKPTAVIPISGSHQEENVYYFKKQNAVVFWDENNLTPENFVGAVGELLNNEVELESLSRNIKEVMPSGAAEKITEEILKVIKR